MWKRSCENSIKLWRTCACINTWQSHAWGCLDFIYWWGAGIIEFEFVSRQCDHFLSLEVSSTRQKTGATSSRTDPRNKTFMSRDFILVSAGSFTCSINRNETYSQNTNCSSRFTTWPAWRVFSMQLRYSKFIGKLISSPPSSGRTKLCKRCRIVWIGLTFCRTGF